MEAYNRRNKAQRSLQCLAWLTLTAHATPGLTEQTGGVAVSDTHRKS